ncbi:MAG: site-specific DNA-methyltransferase [Hydrogenoanaerobacterium sp.]
MKRCAIRTIVMRVTINIWHVPTINSADKRHMHICQKPEEIIRRIIRVSSNPEDLVVDPFMGSGTTAAAAALEGRRWYGFENDIQMCKRANERVAGLTL